MMKARRLWARSILAVLAVLGFAPAVASSYTHSETPPTGWLLNDISDDVTAESKVLPPTSDTSAKMKVTFRGRLQGTDTAPSGKSDGVALLDDRTMEILWTRESTDVFVNQNDYFQTKASWLWRLKGGGESVVVQGATITNTLVHIEIKELTCKNGTSAQTPPGGWSLPSANVNAYAGNHIIPPYDNTSTANPPDASKAKIFYETATLNLQTGTWNPPRDWVVTAKVKIKTQINGQNPPQQQGNNPSYSMRAIGQPTGSAEHLARIQIQLDKPTYHPVP